MKRTGDTLHEKSLLPINIDRQKASGETVLVKNAGSVLDVHNTLLLSLRNRFEPPHFIGY